MAHRATLRVAVNPPSIAAGATANVDVATPDVHRGHAVVAIPPDTLEAGLVFKGCNVVADGSLRFTLSNPTAGAVDGAALDWTVLVFDES